eukprot:CAMPEP_0175496234 /NCGR_PEP_ID=MMETSP0096-20121207/4200_1 /TAXON_ID=311494 /ORGANISM="Alexandrium monilatum, Strain CCMP3105" /LENGTH=67 /DNA_ID=CAMNT_0016798237 /DNA_START=337 /DNA_END=540 /DNA_ORIENTATION=+
MRSSARSGNPTKRSSSRRGATSAASASGPISANSNSALHAATCSVPWLRAMLKITCVTSFASLSPIR